MQVTVEDGYITDITVLSFRDDREFFQKAQSAVISAILTEQTSDVEVVSGATFSSNSIMDAVADALGTVSVRQEQSASEEGGSETGQPGAGEEGGPETGQPGVGGGNGHSHGWGQPGNGGHGRGWHGGSGEGGRRGRRN